MRFEIIRLADADEAVEDSTVVDAAAVAQLVHQAAEVGQRLRIRPADG